LIKNKTSKKSIAVSLLLAKHRLILSGTPIQNNVTELWTLMDFLMPGFLGSEEVFNSRYSSPIKKIFKPDATEAETDRGQRLLESLQKQVLPFIMRRLKSDVLKQIPSKVIYDEEIEMTDCQKEIYHREFVNSQGHGDVDIHVFTKMKRELDLCIHPWFVDRSIPRELKFSGKLMELRDLLLARLGFGGGKDSMKNRVLIFAQNSQTIDIVCELVLGSIPGLTYDIYDGRVSEFERNTIIANFKKPDGKDILVLTTKIGGLGLDLPMANIVIFVENSWNPKEDDQAMDRAHRLGQRRQVLVFNLATKGTCEMRILDTQKRKRRMIDVVINDENLGLQTMNVDGLFDGSEPPEEKEPDSTRKLTAAQAAKEAPVYDHVDQYHQEEGDESGWTHD
jgi:TATA-binding protein-associated factor